MRYLRSNRYLAPRILTEEQHTAIAAKIASPFKIEYAFVAVTEEEVNLAIALSENSFAKAGWTWVNWPGGPNEIGTHLPGRKMVGHMVLSGIQVRVFNSHLVPVANSLVAALKDAGLGYVRIDAADGPGNPNARMLIEIMIGQKPRLKLPK